MRQVIRLQTWPFLRLECCLFSSFRLAAGTPKNLKMGLVFLKAPGKICSLGRSWGRWPMGPIIGELGPKAHLEGIDMRIFMICLMLSTTLAWAQSKVAQVKMLRGEASLKNGGKLTQDQWVSSGVVIVTAEKSFVRLMFIDKSQMNIGPNSEMKIEQFGGGDAGVIDLVKGKIRSQVSKDYLQQKDKDKSKMFIKTPNAVMGIRGTDFMISTNGINTSAVLFEGEVVFEKLAPNDARGINTDRLEAVVDRGVRIMPGEFSVVEATRPNPTVPSLLNVQQVETLEKNQDFSESAATDAGKVTKSTVPGGLSGATVANAPTVLSKELEQTGVNALADAPAKVDAETAKGFTREDTIKPTSGSFLHVDSGVVIAPPKDAVFDSNSGTYVASSSSGAVDKSGSFVAPPGMAITYKGEVFSKVGNEIVKLDRLSSVAGQGATFGDVASVIGKTQPETVAGSAPAAVGANDGKGPPSKGTVSTAVATTIAQATSTDNFKAPPPPPGSPGPVPGFNPQDGKPRIEPPTLCPTCAFVPGGADSTEKTKVNIGTTVGP